MSRETILIAFLALLCALALDWLSDTHYWSYLFIVGVAIWGVCSTLSLSYRLEEQQKAYRAKIRQLTKELQALTPNTKQA